MVEPLELVKDVFGVALEVKSLIETWQSLKETFSFLSLKLGVVVQVLDSVKQNTMLNERFSALEPLLRTLKFHILEIEDKSKRYCAIRTGTGVKKKVKKVASVLTAKNLIERVNFHDKRVGECVDLMNAVTLQQVATPKSMHKALPGVPSGSNSQSMAPGTPGGVVDAAAAAAGKFNTLKKQPSFYELHSKGQKSLVGNQVRHPSGSWTRPAGPVKVRLVHISDTHGLLTPENAQRLPDGDVLIVSGDFTNEGTDEEIAAFDRVLATLSTKYPERVVVPGSADVTVYEDAVHIIRAQLPHATHVPLYESVVLDSGLTLWGSPWFYGHTWNYERRVVRGVMRGNGARFNEIPIGGQVQVVVSHGPARGVLDEADGVSDNHTGSEELHAALKMARAGVHLFGKYHEQNGCMRSGGLLSVNSALKNRWGVDHWLENPPHVVTASRDTFGNWSYEVETSTLIDAQPGSPERPIRMVHISDTHMLLTEEHIKHLPDGDVLVCSGDFTTKGSRKDYESFNVLLGALARKYQHRVVCLGRMDLIGFKDQLVEAASLLTNATAVPLFETVVVSGGLRLYVSPWFFNHTYDYRAYDASMEGSAQFDQIPSSDAFDVLVTHGPPYGALDEADGKAGNHCGSQELADALVRSSPVAHLFGCVHEQNGTAMMGSTLCVNSALKNRWQGPVLSSPPHVITFIRKNSAWTCEAEAGSVLPEDPQDGFSLSG